MMKKLAVAGVLILIAVAAVMVLVNRNPRRTTVAREWPMGLGPLESVHARYPKQVKNEAARELERLSEQVSISFARRSERLEPDKHPVNDYVRAQLQKADRVIDPAPPLPDVTAIREHLLTKGPIVFDLDMAGESRAPMPNLIAHSRLARLLIANAFERARRGDAGAWDDLRAAREVSRGLWRRPELASAMVALAIDRFIVTAARKMPSPPPAWFGEMRTFDYRKALMAAMQADTWLISTSIKADEDEEEDIYESLLSGPYLAIARADFLALQREAAYELSKVNACGWDAQKFTDARSKAVPFWNLPAKMATPNLAAAWQRLFRLRAELELTEHVHGLRSGTESQCPDGQWIVTAESIKFSRPIELDGQGTTQLPLEFVVIPKRSEGTGPGGG
jgi:hypothetical protein